MRKSAVFVVDDDISVREALKESAAIGRARGGDVLVSARILLKPRPAAATC